MVIPVDREWGSLMTQQVLNCAGADKRRIRTTGKIGTIALMAAMGLGFVAFSATDSAAQSTNVPTSTIPAAAGGDARAPYAWVEFCRKYPGECRVNTAEPERIELTPKLWKTIVAMNHKINRDIDPVTDMEHWGVVDRWDMAEDGRGDCEEYVNVKRKKLAEAGIPRRAMLVTVVIDEENAGHAVLMIRTDRGDLILDNKRNSVLSWQQTGYVYVKREAQDRVAWTSLGGVAGPTTTAAR
jgi:predicted transglutaminase-like cysteine proteinase